MHNLTRKEHSTDLTSRKRALRDVAQVLSKLPNVLATKVRAGNQQLAWVQNVANEKVVIPVFLVMYSPGVWRLTNHYHVIVPKSFWPNPDDHRYGTMHRFEWSILPDQFDSTVVATLLHQMAEEGNSWDQDNLGKRWSIFPGNEHAHYAWSVEAKNFMDERYRKEEEQKKIRMERRAARIATEKEASLLASR